MPSLSDLQKRIAYSFGNPELLERALTHKSYANENKVPYHNERMEFLGDSVLNLIVSEYLMKACPDSPEGVLSRLRAAVVSEPALAAVAREIGLGSHLLLGKGEEQTGGRDKDSLLANCLEALVASIYQDRGLSATEAFILRFFEDLIKNTCAARVSLDYKTELQELCQERLRQLPEYRVASETGPDHQKQFEVEVWVEGERTGHGSGRSKKEAEQQAARSACTAHGKESFIGEPGMIIPFFIPHSGCPHLCVFCNQKNITGRSAPEEASSIPQKITEYLKTNNSGEPVQAAFYGGSFTALPVERQKSYLEAVRPFILSGRIRNIRLSTRPDNISREIVTLLKEYRVQTVELGVQSMDDRVLALSGRGHSASDTVHAVQLLREYDFVVGLQLMPGLPGDSAEGFQGTVAKTVALKPDFVRLYPALVIKGTPLEERYKTGRYSPLSLDDAVILCRDALLRFEEAGIEVIRIGLQPTDELEKPGTIIAGPYHPAFRQLVESSILLDRMKALMTTIDASCHQVTFFVHPRDLAAAIGQNRSNGESLKNEFRLRSVRVRQDRSVPRRTVKISGEKPVDMKKRPGLSRPW